MFICYVFMALCFVSTPVNAVESNQMLDLKIKNGLLHTQDKQGKPLILEWLVAKTLSTEFATAMASVWECANQVYTPIEISFLKQFPEVVGTELSYKQFEPLFAQGIKAVDWASVEAIMEARLKNHFVYNPALFPATFLEKCADDYSIIVVAKNPETNAVVGFVTFMIKADYMPGIVKMITTGVIPAAQWRGIEKLLMSSLFVILPNVVKRIFLCARITDTESIEAFQSWGFEKDQNPIQDSLHAFNLKHWVFMNYDATKSNTLQQNTQQLHVQ